MKIMYENSNVVQGFELINEGKYAGACVKRMQEIYLGRVTDLYIVSGQHLINLSTGAPTSIDSQGRYEIVNAKIVVE